MIRTWIAATVAQSAAVAGHREPLNPDLRISFEFTADGQDHITWVSPTNIRTD